jgi:hypothetical protein
MNLIEDIKNLDLPYGEYSVVGSAAMSVRGLREHKDVDILVTKSLYEKLKEKGWNVKQVRLDFQVVEFGIFEASPDMVTLSNYKPDIQTIINNSEIIDGIPFSNLQDVLDFKIAMGREKDLKDVELIKNFLKKIQEN